MHSYLYLFSFALIILAAVLRGSRKRNSLRSGDITGNAVVGDVSGDVSQVATARARAEKPRPDRVAWVIAIIGVLVSVVTLITGNSK
ncbi:hypothetical protein [Rhodopila sp.]|uniref:hypothetical protein n=1 Tax=Rhodopila sp. TaxID=2480087 RepID=UPI003D0C094D